MLSVVCMSWLSVRKKELMKPLPVHIDSLLQLHSDNFPRRSAEQVVLTAGWSNAHAQSISQCAANIVDTRARKDLC